MTKKALGLFVFLVSFFIFLTQSAPAVTAGDSGEFITAAGTLSLPHAPSFPLFMISSRAFVDLIPWGAIPYRVNIFSAFLSSLSLIFLFEIAVMLTKNLWLSVLFPFSVGFTFSLWTNSLVTEVFALNSFFACLLLFGLMKSVQDYSYLRACFLFFGLGLGNHHILIGMAPALGFVLFKLWRKDQLSADLGLPLLFLLGLSIYLVLPLRAAKTPPLNWGNPSSVNRFIRTLTRKDYGSFSLALGEAPQRTVSNTLRHLKNFGDQLSKEMWLPIWLVGLAGLLDGVRRRSEFVVIVALTFLISGPAFYLLANLPFGAQSEGIMGRFFIMPAICLMMGWLWWANHLKKMAPVVMGALVVVMLMHGLPEASQFRQGRLVWDYGQGMLRTLKPNSVLFMDGGDDAFYSLACLHYVLNKRPDVELHDRGGLVFANVYGEDFRRLTREQKGERRHSVEKTYLATRPVYYSSMDQDVLPGVSLHQTGFLLEANAHPPFIDWAHLVLRSLYPLDVRDYRTRALAAFFPYMKSRQAFAEKNIDQALLYARLAALLGVGVDWVQSNLTYDYSHLGYEFIMKNDFGNAQKIYLDWMAFDPRSYQAQSNYGVVLEKLGRQSEAIAQYEKTAKLFPNEADPLYNIAVSLWPTKDWARIRPYLAAAVTRNPQHQAAAKFLQQVDAHLAQGR